MSTRLETDYAEFERKRLEALMRSRNMAVYGPGALFITHPKLAISAVLVPVAIFVLIAIFGPRPDGPEKREAYDRAKLDCRLAGGAYEYFGTQGYHCIGGKK